MAHPFAERLRRRPAILYALVDAGLLPRDQLAAHAWELAREGVDLVQLRAKGWEAGALLACAQELLARLRPLGVPLLINDRADVALAGGADGVHLGQDDLPVRYARQLLGPDALIGWSTHALEEIRRAPREADYLAFGSVFATTTRADSVVVGPAALTAAVAASTLPLLAIGGIRPENVDRLAGLGLAGIAVASGLTRGDSAPGAVPAFRAALARW
jgi:thiamine-phosphate pyrophosphorylase